MPEFGTTTQGWNVGTDDKTVWLTWVINSLPTTSAATTYTVTSSSTVTNIGPTWQIWNDKQKGLFQQSLINAYQEEQTRAWVSWNTNHLVANQIYNGVVSVVQAPPKTAEQRAAEEAQILRYQEERRRESVRIELETKTANEKAEKLLHSALSAEQKEELKSKGFFHCRSKVGNLYRIYKGSHGNVKKIVGGKEVEKLCVQPNCVPVGDSMLAQKLHIECNEDEFRRTANITPIFN